MAHLNLAKNTANWFSEYLRPSCELIPEEPPAESDASQTVNRLLVLFLRHAKVTYLDRDGNPSRQYGHFRTVARILRSHSGRTLVSEFGPKRLKEVREVMIARGRCSRKREHPSS